MLKPVPITIRLAMNCEINLIVIPSSKESSNIPTISIIPADKNIIKSEKLIFVKNINTRIDKYIDMPPTNGTNPLCNFLLLGKSTRLKKGDIREVM